MKGDFSCACGYVGQSQRGASLHRTKKHGLPFLDGEVAALYQSGQSIFAIRTKYQVDQSTIRKCLLRQGIEIRPSWRYMHSNERKRIASLKLAYSAPEKKERLRELGRQLQRHPNRYIATTERRTDRHKAAMASPEFAAKSRASTIRSYALHPEIKEKLRQARLKQTLPTSNTGPEIAVAVLLDELGISYWKQHRVGRFLIDLVVPSAKLAIEINGCYWHCCPTCFFMAKGQAQQRNLDQAGKKRTYLITHGWRILYVWEHELSSPEIVRIRIEKEVTK